MKRLARGVTLALWLLSFGPQAQAHGSVRGLGDFMGGFVHPLLEPTHLVALIALSLLIAQRGLQRSSRTLVALAAASAAGLLMAASGWSASTDTPLLVAASLAGLIVMVARPLPLPVDWLAAAAIGLGLGLGSAPEGLQGASRALCLLGTWFGIGLCTVCGPTLLEELKRPWVPLLIRVVGSWMTATALLVLALHTLVPRATLEGSAKAAPHAVQPGLPSTTVIDRARHGVAA